MNTETANILPESSTPNLARVEDGLVESERSGRYRIDCPAEGAEVIPAYLVVVSGSPNRVIIDPQPNLEVYPVGTILEVSARAVDAFENLVTDADLVWTSAPNLPTFGRGRFRLADEGDYTVSVSIEEQEDTC